MKSTHKSSRPERLHAVPSDGPSGGLQFKKPIWLVMQSALGKYSVISNKAVTVLDAFALDMCALIVHKVREAAVPSKVLAKSQLQEVVHACLPGSLATRAIDQANRVLGKRYAQHNADGSDVPPREASVDAPPAQDEPLHFSSRQLEGYIRSQGMTTHTEFLVRELLVQADKEMREKGGRRITPGELHRAVQAEEDLNTLFLRLIKERNGSLSSSSTPPPSASCW